MVNLENHVTDIKKQIILADFHLIRQFDIKASELFKAAAFFSTYFDTCQFSPAAIGTGTQYKVELIGEPNPDLKKIDGNDLIMKNIQYFNIDRYENLGKKRKRCISMSIDLKEKITAFAEKTNLSKAEIIRFALMAYAGDSYHFGQHIDSSGTANIGFTIRKQLDNFIEHELKQTRDIKISTICLKAINHLFIKINHIKSLKRTISSPIENQNIEVPDEVKQDMMKHAQYLNSHK